PLLNQHLVTSHCRRLKLLLDRVLGKPVGKVGADRQFAAGDCLSTANIDTPIGTGLLSRLPGRRGSPLGLELPALVRHVHDIAPVLPHLTILVRIRSSVYPRDGALLSFAWPRHLPYPRCRGSPILTRIRPGPVGYGALPYLAQHALQRNARDHI